MDNQNIKAKKKSFLTIMKSNAIDFFIIYVFVGAIPFIFAGFKFDKFNFGVSKIIGITVISGLVLFFLYCLLIYLKNYMIKSVR